MKIFTRRGDDGSTEIRNRRTRKDDPLIASVGTIDELSCAIGVAKAWIENDPTICQHLTEIQNTLIDLNAEIASGKKLINSGHIGEIESLIERYGKDLPELNGFVVPGGPHSAALLHQARAISRRAERTIVAACSDEISPEVRAYLNRLSDLLFVMARHRSNGAD